MKHGEVKTETVGSRDGEAPLSGLELSRAYYAQYGKPMLDACFPEHAAKMAIGLAGEGSECFGFDDALSADHDFGPRFCIWMTPDDYAAIGSAAQAAYERLPRRFMNFQVQPAGAHGGRRSGVMTIADFYLRHTGATDANLSLMQWLRLPETGLAAATNGEVFHDPPGAFTAIRNVFLACYPEDVRIKKIAARAASMAQSGQYNYARCMRRADPVGARLALDEFLRSAVSMLFLLGRRYMPFYKWAYRAARALPLPPETAETLVALASGHIDPSVWENPPHAVLNTAEGPDITGGLNTADPNVRRVEQLCALVADIMRQQGITEGNEDFLVAHAERAMTRIQDAAIRSLHMMDG